MQLNDLALQLNGLTTDSGVTFEAVITDQDTLEVLSSNNTEFPIYIACSDTQLLAVTHLFSIDEVKSDKVDELNSLALELGPVVPLSAIGKQADNYILYGAMPVDTPVSHLAEELATQAANTIDVLDEIADLLA